MKTKTASQRYGMAARKLPAPVVKRNAKSADQIALGAKANARKPSAKTKTQHCLDLLVRRDGASLVELMAATSWQAHSVRGFLSGTVKKKLGLSLEVMSDADGNRRYHVTAMREVG